VRAGVGIGFVAGVAADFAVVDFAADCAVADFDFDIVVDTAVEGAAVLTCAPHVIGLAVGNSAVAAIAVEAVLCMGYDDFESSRNLCDSDAVCFACRRRGHLVAACRCHDLRGAVGSWI
jgi:hypothetical protein